MTPQMKAFMLELADLMEKHDVQLEVEFDQHAYGAPALGVTASMDSKYDHEQDKSVRDFCEYRLGLEFDGQDVRLDAETEV